MKIAAIFLSLALAVQARVEIADVDPVNYVSKDVPDDVAAGGIFKLRDQGVLSFNNEKEARNERKGNLRALQSMFNDDQYYGGNFVQAFNDDQLVTEEELTIEYYQDNRFTTPNPIFADAELPSAIASGNRWLYANVPLQPIFGINDLPIQGLAQGFCESTLDDQDGFCHFTYEFFDLRNGAIVVYASIVAEGATRAQGPSTINIIGGTGEFAGAVGEITLWPVGIDESIIPARIFRDGSLFLGNRNGFEAKFEVSIRYLVNQPLPIPVPATPPVAAPVSLPDVDVGVLFPLRVSCEDQDESEYCDCEADCVSSSTRCNCEDAQACCGR